MKRREDRPITKHTINLYAGDYKKLVDLYSARVGGSKAIRDIIRAHIRKIEDDAAAGRPRLPLEALVDELEITSNE